MKSVEITFLGHASFRFIGPGGEVIYFDPWLDDNPMCSVRINEVDHADVV